MIVEWYLIRRSQSVKKFDRGGDCRTLPVVVKKFPGDLSVGTELQLIICGGKAGVFEVKHYKPGVGYGGTMVCFSGKEVVF